MKRPVLQISQYILGFIFILYLSIWALSPFISRHFIEQQLTPLNLTLNEKSHVSYNPFISKVIIEDLQINNQQEKVIAIQRLELETSVLRLLFKEIYFSTFDVNGVYAKITLVGEKITIAGVELPSAASNKTTVQKVTTNEANNAIEAYYVSLPTFELVDSLIDLTIDQQAVPIQINTITINNAIADIINQQADIVLDANFIQSHLLLTANAKLTKQEGTIDSTINLSEKDLSAFEPWLPNTLTNLAGSLGFSTKANIMLSREGQKIALKNTKLITEHLAIVQNNIVLTNNHQEIELPELLVELATDGLFSLTGYGSLNINDLSVSNNNNPEQIIASIALIENEKFELTTVDSIPALSFNLFTIHNAAFSFTQTSELPAFTEFSQLAIHNAYISQLGAAIDKVTLADLNINTQLDEQKQPVNLIPINEALRSDKVKSEPTELTTAEDSLPTTPYHIALNSFELITDSKIFFKDISVEPIFQRELIVSQLHFGPLDSNNPEQESLLSLEGKSSDYAKLSLTGVLKPFLNEPFYSVKTTLNEVSLPEVSTYIKSALKHEIKSGQLNVAINATLSGKKVTGETDILLRGLDFGAADDEEVNSLKSQTAIPFSAALSMLKDSQGNVELNVPLSGSTDDPSFGLSGFATLLIKQATMRAAKDYLMTTFVPYANVVSIAMTAGEFILKVRFNDLEYKAFQVELDEKQQSFLAQFAALMKDKPDTQVTICPIATMDDLAAGHTFSKKEITQKLSKLSMKRFNHFKNQMINIYQIQSSRLLMCSPKIDSSEDAKPRLTFNT